MARLKRKLVKLKQELYRELPILDLLQGMLRKKPGKGGADYESRYWLKLALIEDESPIKRGELYFYKEGSPESTRLVLPIAFWEELREMLGEFLPEVKDELTRRGVNPRAFKKQWRG